MTLPTLPLILTSPTPRQLRTAGLVLLAVGLLYYLVVMRPSLPYAYYVLAKYRYAGLASDFVRARARALIEGAQSFSYQNKTFITSTGLVQK